MNHLLFFTNLFLVAVVSLLVSGAVIQVLWGWFIVPMGIVPITYVQAAGLCLIARVVLPQAKGESMSLKHGFAFFLLFSMVTLIVGYILQLFM